MPTFLDFAKVVTTASSENKKEELRHNLEENHHSNEADHARRRRRHRAIKRNLGHPSKEADPAHRRRRHPCPARTGWIRNRAMLVAARAPPRAVAAWAARLRGEHARTVRHRHDDLRALCPGRPLPEATLRAVRARLAAAQAGVGGGGAGDGAGDDPEYRGTAYPRVRRAVDAHFAALRVLQSLVRDVAAAVLGRKFSARNIPPLDGLELECTTTRGLVVKPGGGGGNFNGTMMR